MQRSIPPPTEQAFNSITRYFERRHVSAGIEKPTGSFANTRDNGFSLVELSIVLVILGLLTGGILTGQNLIRNAELRKIVTFPQQFISEWHTFRDKYMAIPGDMPNATAFWGRYDTDNWCNTQPGTPGPQGTCNGDGNGRVYHHSSPGSPGFNGENFFVNHHLYLSGITQDRSGKYNYSSTTPIAPYLEIPGINASRLIWHVGSDDQYTELYPSGTPTEGSLEIGGNALQVAHLTSSIQPLVAVLPPEEAWNIDRKIDDGMPLSGRFRAFNGRDPSGLSVLTCVTLSGSAYEYALTNTDSTCRFIVIMK